jgi:hypothetical protein
MKKSIDLMQEEQVRAWSRLVGIYRYQTRIDPSLASVRFDLLFHSQEEQVVTHKKNTRAPRLFFP